ncbi:MAG: hypothetical protein KAT46_03195 [Deltaproteobacteria bacterium]|nr:hypothetical protein [Deltaproteobacteria bacterium]
MSEEEKVSKKEDKKDELDEIAKEEERVTVEGLSGSAKDLFKKGLKLYKKKRLEEACPLFEKAYNLEKKNPDYMSYHGLTTALRWGKIGLGIELCTRAIKIEAFDARYYVNLGTVYMHAENKRGAITVCKKGLRFDPDNYDLHEILILVGVRKRQVIPFLKRSNFLNKILGTFFRRTLPEYFRTAPPKKNPADEKDIDVGL